jgi:hypothetical protein
VTATSATSVWKAWLDASKLDGARVVVGRLAERVGLEVSLFTIEPYWKGGFLVQWSCQHDVTYPGSVILEVLRLGEALASGWSLLGSVDDNLEGLVSKTGLGRISIPGITMLSWQLSNPGAS